MTREEAIERLKQNKAAAEFYAGMVQNTNVIENELKDIEAMNMAIEALRNCSEKPNGSDHISRQDAINEIKNVFDDVLCCKVSVRKGLPEAVRRIEMMPSVGSKTG